MPHATTSTMRAIAFHLPQFHPIPENDLWWEPGFTEWTNVVRARPLFDGHYQPHLPADLGFYDLRLPESREAQATLARATGIHGFCYYHYWFNGRRVLERPVDDIITTGRPNFPFCLCWANENWTRRWDGHDEDLLLGQSYSAEDDLQHVNALLRYFRHPGYITVDGRPLFLIYRLSRLPDPDATIARWRQAADDAKLPGLYICNVECLAPEHGLAVKHDVDAAIEFAPDWNCTPKRIIRWKRRPPWFRCRPETDAFINNAIYDYGSFAANMLAKAAPPYLRYPCVTPMWDNSARRKEDAIIFANSTPELYQEWLAEIVSRFSAPSAQENFIFINAWNEWAEGNHLEPCQRWGHQYLEATRAALAARL